MNILVIGGNRLIGKHLVKYLLVDGNHVTIANRGLTSDSFGSRVDRIVFDRTDAKSISMAFGDKHYDIVYDSLAYSSNDVKCLLDILKCGKYIMTSSISVYPQYKTNMKESDFEPVYHQLKWCWRKDNTYGEAKRQAECALYQLFNHVLSIAVRFPFVTGEDDYTNRLCFYVDHVVKSIPMLVDNSDEKMSFITSDEAGRFLAWLSLNDFCGRINASSRGTISICDIIQYVEKKTGVSALYSPHGEAAPFNGVETNNLDLQKAESLGFMFSNVGSWIYNLLDSYMVS